VLHKFFTILTNGFDSSIIDNKENRIFLPAANENAERFEVSFSGDLDLRENSYQKQKN
jgi:hypothetical protein